MSHEDPPAGWAIGRDRWDQLQAQGRQWFQSYEYRALRDRLFAPGTFLGDAIAAYDVTRLDPDREAAIRRLAATHFSKGRLFYPARWQMLASAFSAWRGGAEWAEAWLDLAAARILQAMDQTQYASSWGMGSWYDAIRRRARPYIERDLLGRTTDAGDPVTTLIEYYLPPSPDEILALADIRMDLLSAIGRLPENEQGAALAFALDIPDDLLAEHEGVTPAAIRKRRSRACAKLRRFLDPLVTK